MKLNRGHANQASRLAATRIEADRKRSDAPRSPTVVNET